MKNLCSIQMLKKEILLKYVRFFALILISFSTYAQSKKEQILQLNQKGDSLIIVIKNEQRKTDSLLLVVSQKENQIVKLNDEILVTQKKIHSLETELENENSLRKKDKDGFIAQIGDLEKKSDDLKFKINQMVDDLNQKQVAYNELKNSYKSLEQNLAIAQHKIIDKDLFIDKLVSSNDSLINSLQNSNQVLINTIKAGSISTIKIGTQVWMQEDLKVKNYNNGDPIFQAQSPESWEEFGKKRIGCYRILKNGTFCYNGYALKDPRGLTPSGFVVPTFYDFNVLFKFLGAGNSRNGKAALSMATYPINFDSHDGEKGPFKFKSNGQSGFNAKRGGFIYDHGGLDNMWDTNFYNCSYWWTSSASKIEGGDESEMVEVYKVVDIGYCSQDLGGGFNEDQFMPLSFGFALRPIKK